MKLEIRNLMFNSTIDEKVFFDWIKGISAITSTSGEGNKIFLELNDVNLPDSDLRELIGLYERYGIDMRPLAAFANDRNRSWFENNKLAYWHVKIFGK